MQSPSQNMQAAKCLKFSGCGVHLEITLCKFIFSEQIQFLVLVLDRSFYILTRKCSSFPSSVIKLLTEAVWTDI